MPRTRTVRRKQPRTFSLSADVIDVLERYKEQGKASTLTSAFEEIVREWKRIKLGEQFTDYYDSLSEKEQNLEKQWGEFAETQMQS